MLYHRRPKKVYLFLGIVEFREQLNGLSNLVELEHPEISFQDSWFVYISRNNKQVKLLYWRGAGLCLWLYRLEESRFEMPRIRSSLSYGISWNTLRKFLDGYNIFEGQAHKKIHAKRFS